MTHTGRTERTRATGIYLALFAVLALIFSVGTAGATGAYPEPETAAGAPQIFGCHTLDPAFGICIHPSGDQDGDLRLPTEVEVGCHQTLDWSGPDARDPEVWLDWAYAKSAGFARGCVDRTATL